MNTCFAPTGFCGPNCNPNCIPGIDCSYGAQPWNSFNGYGSTWNSPFGLQCPVGYAWNSPFAMNPSNNINWNGYNAMNSFGYNTTNGYNPINTYHGFPGNNGSNWNVPSYAGVNQGGFNPFVSSYGQNWNTPFGNAGAWNWNSPSGNGWNTPFAMNPAVPFGWNAMNWGMPFGMIPSWFNTQQQNSTTTKGSKKGETEGVVANGYPCPFPFPFAGFTPFGFFNNPFCNTCEPTSRNAA